MKKCENCQKEIVDATPYGYHRNWIHHHSESKLCNAPGVAIPMKEE